MRMDIIDSNEQDQESSYQLRNALEVRVWYIEGLSVDVNKGSVTFSYAFEVCGFFLKGTCFSFPSMECLEL